MQNDKPTDPFAELASQLSDSDYEDSYDKYLDRFSSLAPEPPKTSIFDLASELGRGLLATPNTGVGSAFQGLGVGFDNLSQKLNADKKMYEDRRREVMMMASQMAMQDER